MLFQCNREVHCNILLSYCHFSPAHPRFFRTLSCPAAFAGWGGLSFSVSAVVAAALAISESSALGLWIDRITSDTLKWLQQALQGLHGQIYSRPSTLDLLLGLVVRFNGHRWTQNHTRIWPDTSDERRWRHQKGRKCKNSKLNWLNILWDFDCFLSFCNCWLLMRWMKLERNSYASQKRSFDRAEFLWRCGLFSFLRAYAEATCLRDQNGSLRGAKFQKICLCSLCPRGLCRICLRGFIPEQYFKLATNI